jgi:hypothetical protein
MITLSPTQQFVINGLLFIESQIPNTFVYNTVSYNCIASISDFARELEVGGFILDKMLTLTVRLYDGNGNNVFLSTQLKSKEKISYNNSIYRISTIKTDATGTHLILVCYSTDKGQHG